MNVHKQEDGGYTIEMDGGASYFVQRGDPNSANAAPLNTQERIILQLCQEIEALKPHRRVETGAYAFNDDWAGTFIRGDQSAFFAMIIDIILTYIRNGEQPDPISLDALKDLQNTLEECYGHHKIS